MTEGLDAVRSAVEAGRPLDEAHVRTLATATDLLSLGMLADEVRRRRHGDTVTFARVAALPIDEIGRVDIPDQAGELRIVGRPESPEAAEAAVTAAAHAGVPVTAFSLDDLAALAGGDPARLEPLLARLRVAGLSAVAELPVDRCPEPERALAAAAGAGLPVSRVTLHESRGEARLDDIRRVASWTVPPRAVWAFAPLPRVDDAGRAGEPATGYDDVRQVALARLVVDNIDTIQVDWALHGPKLAQVALTFGANDVDAVPAVDTGELGARRAPLEEIRRNIRAASFVPVERNGCFESVTR